MALVSNFWQLFVLSAPWLMLGLLLAGILNVFLPSNFLQRHLGKEGFFTTVKAALIGAPMPLCSCGVIPAAIGLRRAGASKSATTAFLVSTPETGVDSVSVSYVLLGPFMAIIRPIAAVSSAIVAGVLVGSDKSASAPLSSNNSATSCCASKKVEPEKPSCCASKQHKPTQPSFWQKVLDAVRFSCNKLLEDTAKWLLIGLFFAALVQTYIPASFLSQYGSGLLAMVVMVLVSIPMYICATASTPIAAGLLMAGVSPGAVLVFMLAGPATNIATLGVVGSELGKRAVAAYLTAVIGVAFLFGWLTDYLVQHVGVEVQPLTAEHHEVLPHWFGLLCAVVLALLLLRLAVNYMVKKRFLNPVH